MRGLLKAMRVCAKNRFIYYTLIGMLITIVGCRQAGLVSFAQKTPTPISHIFSETVSSQLWVSRQQLLPPEFSLKQQTQPIDDLRSPSPQHSTEEAQCRNAQFGCFDQDTVIPKTTPLPTSVLYQGDLFKPTTCKKFLCPLTSLSLLRLMQRPLDQNVLKISSAVVDTRRNRIYVVGNLTPNIAIFDGVTEEWMGTFNSKLAYDEIQKIIHIDSVANYLYIIDKSHQQIKRLDLSNKEVIGPMVIPEGDGYAAVDTKRTRIYISSRKPPYFTVFDGKKLNRLFESSEMSTAPGELFYDEETDLVYVSDLSTSSEQGKLFLWDANKNKISSYIKYKKPDSLPETHFEIDSLNKRFFIVSPHALNIITYEGETLHIIPLSEEIEIQDMVYDVSHDRLALLGLERPNQNEMSGMGGRLLIYDPTQGEMVKDLSFGDKPHALVFNQANYHLYALSTDEANLWSISTDTFDTPSPNRLGDSIEQIVLAEHGSKLYLNSRLGGAYLLGYNVDNGAYESFTSGRCPMPMRADRSGDFLLVLNAWDSTLSVFRAAPQSQWLRTIPLGLPPGTTQRLPDLTVDSKRGVAYAAYPEFGKIAVVDWKNGKVITQIELQGYPKGEASAGEGQLQILADEKQNKLYVLWNVAKHRLQVIDLADDYEVIADVDLTSLDWDKINRASNAEQLFLDEELNRLFIGPYLFDTNTATLNGYKLSRGQRIFAIDPISDSYWALGVEGEGVRSSYMVMALYRKNMSMRQSHIISSASALKPVLAFDAQRRFLYAADMAKAELQIFSVGSIR